MTVADGKYLFIGVGGMGMAPLAGWMAQSGYSVSGYDDYLREPVRRYLSEANVELRDLLLPRALSAFSTVVYSSAIAENHYLLTAAREHGLRIVRRGEMLAEVSAGKRLIAVAGSHGKTTTSGMIAHMISQSDLQVDFILGGFFNTSGQLPSRSCGGEWLVAEVDESDGTIDRFTPEMTLLLNVDWDHPDRYQSAKHLAETFRCLLERTTGRVLIPDSGIDSVLLEAVSAEICTFPPLPEVTHLRLGKFNQCNAAGAAAVYAEIADRSAISFDGFSGMARRQSILLERSDLVVLEDYAHHPRELDALFESLRVTWPEHRLITVFQPHRYSRTKAFCESFAQSLSQSDELYLLPVYSAHESLIEGGRTKDLIASFKENAPPCLSLNVSGLRAIDLSGSEKPAVLAFVGAGDVGELAGVYASLVSTGSDDAAFPEYLRTRLSPGCVFSREEPLGKKTTMRIGGNARFYGEPACLSDLRALLEAARFFELDYFCLGRGSNLLVADDGYDGLVIRLRGGCWDTVEPLGDGMLFAGAGARLKEICGQAARAGMGGFEFLEGIPGSLGGGLRMNAGAMGSWMFDVVERVLYLDQDGRLCDAPKDEFHFGYRKVEEISRGIALGAVLKAPDQEVEESIRCRMDSYSSSRKESQPRGPSAGCIFKNPKGNYAGKLIDELGVKGLSVGGAEVSSVHGNFIVNNGGATSADVIELIRQVRTRVKEGSGYDLEPEVLLVGQCWDEVLKKVEVERD